MKVIVKISAPQLTSLRKAAKDYWSRKTSNGTLTQRRLEELAAKICESHGQRHCVVCGCTDERACAGGCSWVMLHNLTPTGVCSRCWPGFVEWVERTACHGFGRTLQL